MNEAADKEWERIRACIQAGFFRLKQLGANAKDERNQKRCAEIQKSILDGFEKALDIE